MDPKSKDPAFPSHRSWTFASELIKEAEAETGAEIDYDTAGDIAISAIGESVGLEYKAFMKHRKAVNLAEIWKNPEAIKKIIEKEGKDKHELLYAATSSIAEVGSREVHTGDEKKDRFAPAIKVAIILGENGQEELGIYMSKLMKSQMGKKKFVDELFQAKWKEEKLITAWSKQYSKFLRSD